MDLVTTHFLRIVSLVQSKSAVIQELFIQTSRGMHMQACTDNFTFIFVRTYRTSICPQGHGQIKVARLQNGSIQWKL